jgi:hypothetical protein
MYTLEKSTDLFKKISTATVATLLFLAVVVPSVMPDGRVSAGQLASRKITLNSSSLGNVTADVNGNNGAAGGYFNGTQTTHTLNFNTGTAGAIQSIAIMYCTTPLPQTTCTAPTGLVASNLTSVTSTGFGANTWAMDTTTVANAGYFATGQCAGTTPFRQNCALITQTTAVSTAATAAVQINLGVGGASNYMTNPTTAGNYYVRIALFTSANFTGTANDQGTVAFSVNAPIEINSAVQESLAFSISPTHVATGGASVCTALGGGGLVGLGTLNSGAYILSTTGASNANSYFRLSTNASNGTTVAYSGDTLKSSAGTFATNTTGFVNPAAGTEFFGMTFDGANANHSFTNLTRSANYTTDTTYSYNPAQTTPTAIASAAPGTAVTCDTGMIKYGAGASTTTKAGIYKTQIVYYAIPTF